VTVDSATTGELSPKKIPDLFDLGAKVISLSVALTYLVGFFVVAWHLSKHGVSSRWMLSFLRAISRCPMASLRTVTLVIPSLISCSL
jgi:hypothetical protein